MESGLAINHDLATGYPDKSFDELVLDVELEKYLASAKDVPGLIKLVNGLLNKIGLDRFAHTDFRNINNMLEPIGNFDPKVTDKYAVEGFHCDDFMARHLQLHKSPIFRSTIQEYMEKVPFDHELFRRNRDITKFLNEVGMKDCYNIPISDGEYYDLFSVSVHHGEPVKFREVVSNNIKFVHQLAEVVNRVGKSKFDNQIHAPRFVRLPVTPRPIEILDIMANKDLTAVETARLLGLHEVTVNKHIAAAKKGLKANTLPGLLMAAIKAGLISIHLG